MDKAYDYLPFGEEVGGFYPGDADNRARQSMKFTSKERDAETGLDFFLARYYSGAQGRFTSADAPFADQNPEDPQSWNLYAYVRNNPLAHVDQDGRACTALSSFGSFCQRAARYAQVDRELSAKTRFFAAASIVNEANGSSQYPVLSGFAASGTTRSFLSDLGENLETFNRGVIADLKSGALKGSDVDAQIVHREQTHVQDVLKKLQDSKPEDYKKVIEDNNKLLNPGKVYRFIGENNQTDKGFLRILEQVRTGLRRDIDFARQGDREAIGNAIIKHVRETKGCDASHAGIAGC